MRIIITHIHHWHDGKQKDHTQPIHYTYNHITYNAEGVGESGQEGGGGGGGEADQ